MNPKNLTIALAVLATMSFYACTQKPQSAATSPAPSTAGNDDTISVKKAKEYVRNFSRNTVDSLVTDSLVDGDNGRKKRPNTRCIYISIGRLDSLIEKIKGEKGDGIRFYLAAYNKTYPKTQIDTPPKKYWGYSTLIMVSTKYDTLTKHHVDYYKGSPYSNGVGGGIYTFTALPENRGELCPPPATCKSMGATLFDK